MVIITLHIIILNLKYNFSQQLSMHQLVSIQTPAKWLLKFVINQIVQKEDMVTRLPRSILSKLETDESNVSKVKILTLQKVRTWQNYQDNLPLIPKVEGMRDPAQHRPITMSDMVARCFHHILAKCMENFLPFNIRQKLFRTGDGTAESVWFLQQLIQNASHPS